MQDSFDFQRLYRDYPELPYALLAVITYMASALFGIMEMGDTKELYGIRFQLISTTLWMLLGFVSLYFLYTAFFDMWIYAIHLIISYFLAGAGLLTIYLFNDNIDLLIIGIILLVISFVFIIFFIIKIGNIRVYRISRCKDLEVGKERYSLGSWYIIPFLFYGIALASFFGIGYWYENGGELYIYMISEFALIISLVYTLWVPENVLFYGTKGDENYVPEETEPEETKQDGGTPWKKGIISESEKGVESGARESRPSIVDKVTKRKKRSSVECPGSKKSPREKEKECPSCGHVTNFYWCPESQEYLMDCPSCSKKTFYGRKVCVHCKQRLDEKIKCSNCGKSFQLRKFKDAR